MLDVLNRFELFLPDLLKDPNNWNSLYIDYEQPVVERVWCQVNEYRLYLHRIHAISPGKKAFMHPHAWPSAVRLLAGYYRMDIGHIDSSAVLATCHFGPGDQYEMLSPYGTHSVSPIDLYTDSFMVSGPVFDENKEKSKNLALGPLPELTKLSLLEVFKGYYPARLIVGSRIQ